MGALPLATLAMAHGANLGVALNPWSEVAGDADPAAKLVPFGNLLSRPNGVAVALAYDDFNGVPPPPNGGRPPTRCGSRMRRG